MRITINILYIGKNGNAIKFANEIIASGIVGKIRKTEGNLRYEYFLPLEDKESVLLIDSWESQSALDRHHASSTMQEISALREEYDLHMSVQRFVDDDSHQNDEKFIRK